MAPNVVSLGECSVFLKRNARLLVWGEVACSCPLHELIGGASGFGCVPADLCLPGLFIPDRGKWTTPTATSLLEVLLAFAPRGLMLFC